MVLYWILSLATAAGADVVVVGGTGSGCSLIKLLGDEFHKTNQGIEVKIVLPPLSSGGGVRALVAGRIDLAVTAGLVSGEERSRIGEQMEWARTPLVFATRDGQRAAGFQLQDVADAYAGRLAKWDNGVPIRLILRSEFESDTQLLRSLSPGVDRAVQDALRRKGMVIARDDLEAIDLLKRIAGSLGTTTLGLVRLDGRSLTILPVNGVVPSARALAEGKYPWFKSLYLVTSKSSSPGALRFLAFLRSAKARDILKRAEYLPSIQ